MSTQTTTQRVPAFELRHRLDLALEAAGIRPEDVAVEIGRSATTVRNYLSGRTTPSRAVLVAWSLRCGVSLQWLETGEIEEEGPNRPPGQEVLPLSWTDESAGQPRLRIVEPPIAA